MTHWLSFISNNASPTDLGEAFIVTSGEGGKPMTLLVIDFMKNLYIHISFQQETWTVSLNEKYK